MKSKKIVFIMLLACFALFHTDAFYAQGSERRPAKEKWVHETLQATVESINLETRLVLLKGPEGERITVKADERVKRLHEIKAGDIVSVEYSMLLTAEFRDPTPAEKNSPLVVIAEGGRAPKDVDPAAAVGGIIRAVVTIEVINRPNMKVTVKGPRGNYVTIPVEDRGLIEELHVGEVTVITYSEALALSVEKIK